MIEPPSAPLSLPDSHRFHRGAVRPRPVRHICLRSAKALHRPFEKLEGCPAIPALARENLEHLAFVIHGAPEVVRLAIDPNEGLVQVPTPRLMNALCPAQVEWL